MNSDNIIISKDDWEKMIIELLKGFYGINYKQMVVINFKELYSCEQRISILSDYNLSALTRASETELKNYFEYVAESDGFEENLECLETIQKDILLEKENHINFIRANSDIFFQGEEGEKRKKRAKKMYEALFIYHSKHFNHL